MKDKVKGLMMGVLIGSVLTGGTVMAATTTKIEVLYENLKYIVDGVEKKPSTGQGFIYQGTTYVPLRFAGEALGKNVYWDGKTKTITIGEKQGSYVYLDAIDYARFEKDHNRHYVDFGNSGKNKYQIAGNQYLNGVGVYIDSWGEEAVLKYNLNGKYKKLTGFIGTEDYYKNSTEYGNIIILGDDQVLYSSSDLIGGDLPREISIDVTGVLRLEIKFQGHGSDRKLVIAEAKLHN